MPRLNLFGRSDNKLRPVWQATVPDHAIAVAWSPDAKLLAAAAVSGPIAIYDAAGGKPVHQLAGHGFGTTALADDDSVGPHAQRIAEEVANPNLARSFDVGRP